MNSLDTDILVIGGGSTGTGVAWDAALRGLRVVLVEKRDLTHGTTGRYHGLLHSGGRYAVKDPQSAVECIEENRILRRTHAHCIEDTGGLFVVTPEDEGPFPDRFKQGCLKVGIPCEELTLKEAFRREPMLNRRISRVFLVPDGSADSFLSTHATAQAATQAGAKVFVYHEVVSLLVEGGDGDRRVAGAVVRNMVSGEELRIHAAMTINAAGAWAGKLAAQAGIEVKVIPGKGTMVAMNHRIVNTVINRCKMPADGDILVPVHTVAVIGTTDEKVTDPELLRIEPWEVQLMLDEGEKLVPGISKARVLRAWAGVRPLYQEGYSGQSRDATRALTLLDHRQRDGVQGFLTITGGKWTTFRLMAETTMDLACKHLGVERRCQTADTVVPGVEQGHYWLGHRLREVEDLHLQGSLVCECELVTRAMLEQAAVKNPTVTLDDLRRDVRLGMGPCQGGFCTYRAVGILHELQLADERAAQPVHGPDEAAERTPLWDVAHLQSPSHNQGHNQGHTQGDGQGGHGAAALRPPGASPALLLRDFLQERWRGLTPILWGQQLKQERLDELIYLSLMNADHLPDAGDASPMSEFWAFDTTPDSGPDSGPGSGAEGAGRAQKAPGAVAPGAAGAERQAGQVQP